MAVTLPQPKERSLHLAKQVDQASINEITKVILEINENDEQLIKIYAAYDLDYRPKPIKLYIDSYGGAVYQCLGLLGVMKASSVPIHTIVTGCAMSCGFLISIAGHYRYAYAKATLLYHQVSSMARGTVKEMEEGIMQTKKLQEIIENHTIENTAITREKLEKIYKRKQDWYITTKEAFKLKIIDEVI